MNSLTSQLPAAPAPRDGVAPRRAVRRSGFSLNELLIVIAIAVLVMALAVPAFNLITNSRSIDAAENQIAAYLAGARSEALSTKTPRGVFFFTDRDTGRMTLAVVHILPKADYADVSRLELVTNREEVVLPQGVGLQLVPSDATNTNFPWPTDGLIMFDGNGRVLIDQYNILRDDGDPLKGLLAKRVENPAVGLLVPPGGTGKEVTSTIGFALYDGPNYAEQEAATDAVKQKWLEENSVPFVINRYSGTVLRGQ